jgi:hypothetical protein
MTLHRKRRRKNMRHFEVKRKKGGNEDLGERKICKIRTSTRETKATRMMMDVCTAV